MRLSFIILVAVISSVKTASGEMSLNQPQLPADTALWGESGGVIGKRSLRSPDDTKDDELEGTGVDVEDRGFDFLTMINPAKWVHANKVDYEMRQAEKLAALQKQDKEHWTLISTMINDVFPGWREKQFNFKDAKKALGEDGLTNRKAVSFVLDWYRDYMKIPVITKK
ncbi:hypothetical protein PF008_g20942 [Phytophthora fragariae]|uniref:RxLR effector protein n=1 Tax=Phytophthora fragariae TaxID=53985 RepID=A0A6G0QZ31_9STRA|nr:hypothetical protein PF008_g20942 [Phytophthora fragariae]